MKMVAFWGVAPCNLVEVDRRFKTAYYLDQGDDAFLKRRSTSTRLNRMLSSSDAYINRYVRWRAHSSLSVLLA
jgi:hypothetical protein